MIDGKLFHSTYFNLHSLININIYKTELVHGCLNVNMTIFK